MKRRVALCLLLLIAALGAAASPFPPKKEKGDSGRLLTGKVMDHKDRPLIDAVVYLSNTRTRAVKTYIVGPDGVYRFPALSPNVDYEVFAQYKGKKSDTKTLSQFDDRPQANINLRIDTR